MGIKSLEIVLYQCGRSGSNTYKCGDPVHGTVNVNIGGYTSHQLSSMIVKMRGRAKTDWVEDDDKYSETDWVEDDDKYSETQDVFRQDITLMSVAPGGTISLPPGDHQLPFNFFLPERLPHSLKFDNAKVVYECKARLTSVGFWSWNGSEDVKLTVLPTLDLSRMSHLAGPLTVRREDKRRMLKRNPGEFTVTIAKQGYVAGEEIDLWIEGADKVYSELAHMDGEVKLKRLVLAREGKKNKHEHETRTALVTARPGKTPSAWHRVRLTVPEHEITLDDQTLCRIITVSYYIKISDIHLPVTLGTVATRRLL